MIKIKYADADLLDGIDSSQFLRSDANDSTTFNTYFTSSGNYPLDINGVKMQKLYYKVQVILT